MIKRLSVYGYKSLKRVKELSLEKVSIIMGPNASGKSNLFDLLKLLSLSSNRPLNDAFKEHRGYPLEAFFYGEEGFEGLLKKKEVEFKVEIDIALTPEVVKSVEEEISKLRKGLSPKIERKKVVETNLRYCLTVQAIPETGVIRVMDESLLALRKGKDGKIRKSRKPFLSKEGDRLLLRAEGVKGRPREYDIGCNYTIVSVPLYSPHYSHITAFKEEISKWRFYYLEPTSMRKESPIKEVTILPSSGEDIAAFFYTMKQQKPAQFENLIKTLKNLVPSIQKLDIERVPKKGTLDLVLYENGVKFSSRVISEGTLRILGLLAALNPLSPVTLVGYEEPENGVHPRRLQLIAEILKNTALQNGIQILINTHSPVFPEYFENESLFICEKRGFETVFRPFLPSGELFRKKEIEEALEEPPPLSERIMRGDFGG